MISITDSLTVNHAARELKAGRVVDFAGMDRVLSILSDEPEARQRFVVLAVSTFQRRLQSGKRLSGDQLAALRLVDPSAAAEYDSTREQRSHAATTAERVARLVARRSEIGEIPAIVDVERRQACRLDLERFGITYCGLLLKHAPSGNMKTFIINMQKAVLLGGRVHVRWPRGKGKSTWIKIAILWSVLYGHRRFAVCFAANRLNAKAILSDIWKAMDRSESMLEDFPEVCYPVRCIKGVTQRCATQTHNGQPTEILKTSDMLTLPKVAGSVAAGAMIVCRGVEAGTKGLVDMDQRPDFLFFDDIQTKKSSGSRSKTDWLEEFVMQDAMCMGGHDTSIAALMASTPIKPNDLSERFSDSEQHPEWITFTTPLVIKWPKNMELVDEFSKLYRRDMANRDLALTLSKGFYVENQQDLEAGSEVLDPLDGDPQTEVSALHHALILLNYMGREGFNAEYQMQTRRQNEVFALDVETVCNALNGYARCVVPDECRGLVAFCDINAQADAGLRWGVMAVGSGRVCAMVAYGRYPDSGRLYPEKSTPTQMRLAIANGIASVVSKIEALPLRRNNGTRMRPYALCFDCGWETKVVARTIKTMRSTMKLSIAKGFNWKQYRPFKSGGEKRDGVLAIGDHCHISESENGEFLAVHTDYWREEAQRSFLARPLMPGSVSLYGNDRAEHHEFATEVCNERLLDKGTGHQTGQEMWIWSKSGSNHWNDVLSGCFVVASWYRFYDATEEVIGREVAVGEMSRTGLKPARRLASGKAQRAVMRQTRYRLVRK